MYIINCRSKHCRLLLKSQKKLVKLLFFRDFINDICENKSKVLSSTVSKLQHIELSSGSEKDVVNVELFAGITTAIFKGFKQY